MGRPLRRGRRLLFGALVLAKAAKSARAAGPDGGEEPGGHSGGPAVSDSS
ncbi:hypothetical protein GCM10023178_68810 [Actinomadura luteofluorescens]